MADISIKENAVLGDLPLIEALNSINPKFGDFCARVAGEAWGQSLIDQRTKSLIIIAVDVVNANENGPGAPFEAHVHMALQQGVTVAEIEEVLLLMCVYAGFNKGASAFGRLSEIVAKGKTAFGDKV